MTPSLNKAELYFWAALPGLLTVALAIFSLTSKHIASLGPVMPSLPLIPVFYWGMARAREMPYWFLFALGMAMDSVTGQPLGLSSLLYMFFLGLIRAQRKFIHKEGFVAKWLYFSALLLAVALGNWLFLSFFSGGRAAPMLPAFVQWLLTACCYPALHRGFDLLSDHIQARRWRLLHGG